MGQRGYDRGSFLLDLVAPSHAGCSVQDLMHFSAQPPANRTCSSADELVYMAFPTVLVGNRCVRL